MRPGIEAELRKMKPSKENKRGEKGCQGLSGTLVGTDMSAGCNGGNGEICWEGPARRGTGMAHTDSRESVTLNVQEFSKPVDITLVATVEIFTI